MKSTQKTTQILRVIFMQANLKNSLRLTAGALAVATSFFAGGAQAAPSYMAVLPLAGLDANQALRPVDIALADATPPAAMVGVPYEFNLGALLSLDGPEGTTRDKVSWSIVSGELPAGLELVGDRIAGVPEDAVSPGSVIVRAEYLGGYQSVGATQGYEFEARSTGLADFDGYRAWADGTFARSCNEYMRPIDSVHTYTGAAGDGIYRIAPAGQAAFDVPCDMTTDGGGWTLVEYAANWPFAHYFSGTHSGSWAPDGFSFMLTDPQINAIRAVSATAKQRYVGLCEKTVHYHYSKGYALAVGFRYQTGVETSTGVKNYTPGTITVPQDGCSSNGGEGGAISRATFFDIENINLPVVNVLILDDANATQKVGSPPHPIPRSLQITPPQASDAGEE